MPHHYRDISIRLLSAFVCALVGSTIAIAQEEAQPKREPAAVMSFHGAAWLERPGREEEEKPHEVLKVMNLKNGDVVADIGCGTGYYGRKIAKEVAPDGKVYGVDIQPEFIEMIKEFCEKEGITNVIPILGDEDDPKLPKGELDWMILTDVYHEFQQAEAMLAKMREALKPDGKVLLLEYRLHGKTAAHIKTDHRMSVVQVLSEWNAAGFELVDLQEFLPSQHLFVFGKDPDRD
jgi:predicted methyltransferase